MTQSSLAIADDQVNEASGAECERLDALRAYAVLDTEPEKAFDRITQLAAQAFRAPIALISLLDERRQWFKSRCGIDAAETPREISFCDHAIRGSGVMVIPDTHLDERFACNPLVLGEPGMRFYAGAPLSAAEGVNIGTLCIIDRQPRDFGQRDRDMLASFAELVVHELNLRLVLGAKYAEATRGREAIRRAAKLEAALSALLRNSVDAIVASDEQSRVVAWNKGAQDMFGYRAEEIAGRPLATVLSECSRLMSVEAIAEGLQTGQVGVLGRLVETEGIRRDGGAFPIEVSLGSWRVAGGVMFGAVIRDITERKRAEAALREARDRAQIANRAKSEFLANMSHELRTPLNAIIGFSEFMKDELIGPIGSPRYIDYARDINDSGLHLLELVNDILDMAKIEADKYEAAREEIDVLDLVETCARLMRPRAREAGIALLVDVADLQASLWAGRRAAKQILLNLLSNAIKFTHAGGTVSLLVRKDAGGTMEFVVSDTGIGMSADEIGTALEPFGQVDSGLNRRYEGTGLGLPLAVKLTELQGGSLRIDSEEGRGTKARVRLPLTKARE